MSLKPAAESQAGRPVFRSSASCIAVARGFSKARRVALRCLIVDDSEEFLASAKRLLESQGVEVTGSATSVCEAVPMARALAPDVVLVDIELGEEDGFQLTEKLAATSPATRVVLISAYDRQEFADLIGNSTAVGFLPKRSLGAAALERVLGGV